MDGAWHTAWLLGRIPWILGCCELSGVLVLSLDVSSLRSMREVGHTARLCGPHNSFPWILRSGHCLRGPGCLGASRSLLDDSFCTPSLSLSRPHPPSLCRVWVALQSYLLEGPLLIYPQGVSSGCSWKPLETFPPTPQTSPGAGSWSPITQQKKEAGATWLQGHLEMGTNSSSPARDQKLRMMKQKHVCPKGLVTTSWPGSTELCRTVLAPASPETGPSLMPGELTFPSRGWGMWGCSWAPNSLPSWPLQLEPGPEGPLPTVTQPSSCDGLATQGQAGPLQLAERASEALDPPSGVLPLLPTFCFRSFQT